MNRDGSNLQKEPTSFKKNKKQATLIQSNNNNISEHGSTYSWANAGLYLNLIPQ